MSRLFAYMGNDQDRVKCALHPARKLLVADGAASAKTSTATQLRIISGMNVTSAVK